MIGVRPRFLREKRAKPGIWHTGFCLPLLAYEAVMNERRKIEHKAASKETNGAELELCFPYFHTRPFVKINDWLKLLNSARLILHTEIWVALMITRLFLFLLIIIDEMTFTSKHNDPSSSLFD